MNLDCSSSEDKIWSRFLNIQQSLWAVEFRQILALAESTRPCSSCPSSPLNVSVEKGDMTQAVMCRYGRTGFSRVCLSTFLLCYCSA